MDILGLENLYESNDNNEGQCGFLYLKIDNITFNSLKKVLYLFSNQTIKDNFDYDGDQYTFALSTDGDIVKRFYGFPTTPILNKIKTLLNYIYIKSNLIKIDFDKYIWNSKYMNIDDIVSFSVLLITVRYLSVGSPRKIFSRINNFAKIILSVFLMKFLMN